jgi:hypothetical protein
VVVTVVCFLLRVTVPQFVITYPANSYCSQENSLRQYTTMSPDDGRMTETCRGNNIRGGEEELLL